MENHPIQSLMSTTLENIKSMVDVNTILGDPVETPDGSMILPISRVGFGFAAGGSEFGSGDREHHASAAGGHHTGAMGHGGEKEEFPFGGGAGGGVSISPMGFLVVGHGQVKVLSAVPGNQLFDRLIDMAPTLFERLEAMTKRKGDKHGRDELH